MAKDLDPMVKKKIKEAAMSLGYVFENLNITGFKLKDDDVIFYEGNVESFRYKLSDIMNDTWS